MIKKIFFGLFLMVTITSFSQKKSFKSFFHRLNTQFSILPSVVLQLKTNFKNFHFFLIKKNSTSKCSCKLTPFPELTNKTVLQPQSCYKGRFSKKKQKLNH